MTKAHPRLKLSIATVKSRTISFQRLKRHRHFLMRTGRAGIVMAGKAALAKGSVMEYRIAWRSRLTGKTGHGLWQPDSERAGLEALVLEANVAWPTHLHWIEPKNIFTV